MGLSKEQKKRMQQEMDAYYAKLEEERKEFNRVAIRIFKAIKSVKGKKYLKNLLEYMEESEWNDVTLVRKDLESIPEKDWQQERGLIGKVIVNQYVNGGYSGDEYSGYVWVPLKGNLFLKFHYDM